MSEEKLVAKISADSTQLNQQVDAAANKVKEIGNASKEAADKSVAASLKMSAAMSAVKGAAMAAVAAVKMIIQAIDAYKNAAVDAMMKLAGKNLGSVIEINDEKIGKWVKMQDDLRKFYDLANKAKNEPMSFETNRLLKQSKRNLKRDYDLDLDEYDENLIDKIAEQLDKAQTQRIKAIENKINGLNGTNNSLQDAIKKEKGITAGSVARIQRLQAEIDKNAAESRALQKQLHSIKKETVGEDWRKIARAQNADREEKQRAEQIKQDAEQEERHQKEKAEQEAKIKKAEEDLAKATEEEAKARKALRDAKRKLAREQEAEAIANKRDRLQKEKERFGFTPWEGFNVNETALERHRRVKQQRLDETIAEKMAKQYEGKHVHFNVKERARIAERENLVERDKELEAAQNQISAAEKQKQASESIKVAAEKFNAASQKVTDYTGILNSMQTALENLSKNTFIVK